MTSRRKPADAGDDRDPAGPHNPTAHDRDRDHRADHRYITVDFPWVLPAVGAVLDYFTGKAVAQAVEPLTRILKRMEKRMIDFDKKLDKLEEKLDAFDAREAKEDEDSVLTKAENTALKKQLADLQAEIDASGSTPEREARFQALLDRIDASNKIDSEVLPEPTPEPEPEPTPEPTPEPPVDGGDLPTDEVPPEPETPPAA